MKDKPEIKHEKDENSEKYHGKKTYHSPRLQVYGSLNGLTQAKGGNDRDGGPGSPNSKLRGPD